VRQRSRPQKGWLFCFFRLLACGKFKCLGYLGND